MLILHIKNICIMDGQCSWTFLLGLCRNSLAIKDLRGLIVGGRCHEIQVNHTRWLS